MIVATMGMYLSASAYLDRAVIIFEDTLGPSHPETVYASSSAAWILFEQGKLEEALEIYKTALQVREKYFGLEHPEVKKSLYLNFSLIFFRLPEVFMKWQKYWQNKEKYKKPFL